MTAAHENLGILIYPQAQPMDIIGPWEVWSFWKNILQAPINLYLIAAQGPYVECANNIVLKTHVTFETCPKLDYLLVPGGPGRLVEADNKQLIGFIKQQAAHCKLVLSDCTGVFLLQAAGLLNGKSATTYWRALPALQQHKEITVVEERIVKSGSIWTAGGVSSGIDLALALIEALAGTVVAGKVQLLFEYFPPHSTYYSSERVPDLPPYTDNGEIADAALPAYIKRYLK